MVPGSGDVVTGSGAVVAASGVVVLGFVDVVTGFDVVGAIVVGPSVSDIIQSA